MDLIIRHLKGCRAVTGKTCAMCTTPCVEDLTLLMVLGKSQGLMNHYLGKLGMWLQQDTEADLLTLRHTVEKYLYEVKDLAYQRKVYIMDRCEWAWSDDKRPYQGYYVNTHLRIATKTKVICDTFHEVLTAYGALPADIHRRFVRGPSASHLMWPVFYPYNTLAHVEDEKGKLMCIGSYPGTPGSFDPTTPHIRLQDVKLEDIGNHHLYMTWLKDGGIPYVFGAKGTPCPGEKKSPELKYAERLSAYREAFDGHLRHLNALQAQLHRHQVSSAKVFTGVVPTALLDDIARTIKDLAEHTTAYYAPKDLPLPPE